MQHFRTLHAISDVLKPEDFNSFIAFHMSRYPVCQLQTTWFASAVLGFDLGKGKPSTAEANQVVLQLPSRFRVES